MTNPISQRFLPSGEALGLGFGQPLTSDGELWYSQQGALNKDCFSGSLSVHRVAKLIVLAPKVSVLRGAADLAQMSVAG